MRYLILGSAEARDDNGNLLPLGGPRLRALLTALAMRAARPAPVAVDVLIDEVWTHDPPQDAPAALQALVGRLRRAIGRDAVVSAPGGYRLATNGPRDVDLLHFEALAKHGTRALGVGDARTAADVLRQALALWRGPALADLPDRDAAAARPEALRLTALHRRIDADLTLGHAADVIPELRELVIDHPLDETFHAQLIRALHAAGRPADALAAYEAVRRTLADHLGTDPGADLKALHGLLLTGGPISGGPLSGGPVPPSAGTGSAAVRHPGGLRVGAEAGQGPYGPAATRGLEPTRPPYAAHSPSGAARDDEGAHAAQALDGGHADRDPEAPLGTERAAGAATAHGAGTALGSGVVHSAGTDHGADTAQGAGTTQGAGTAHSARTVHSAGTAPGVEAVHGTGAGHGADAAPGAWRVPGAGTADGVRVEHGAGAGHGAGTALVGAPAAPSNGGPGPGGPQGGGFRPRGNLRARLTSFVGRQSEIGDLHGDLRGARLVTLTGPGGSGKTRLSEEAASTVTTAYPDGVWVAELAKLDHPAAVPGTVLSAVGDRETSLLATGLEGRIGPADGADPTARLVELCAHRRLLLLLDNCEHVIDAAARLAETLLAHCPGVTVLATSREPLGVPGETVRPVEPLRPAPAHQLFAERAAATLPGFDPARDADTSAAVAEICRRLDGLPLAIELAAARLRLLTPRQIADRLDDRFRLLTSGSRTLLPRQQTLRAVVDWSWDLLDERERTVLRRASVFAGGWGLSAAEAVCADAPPATDLPATDLPARPHEHIAPGDVLDLLGALVDKSLLVVDHPTADRTPGDPAPEDPAAPEAPAPEGPALGDPVGAAAPSEVRYRMLETIHEYVGERAVEDPAARADHAAAVARHTTHFLDFARTAEPRLRSAEQLHWLRRVETELDNIRAALNRSLEARDEQTATDFIMAMSWFWWLRNYRDEGIAWTREALILSGSMGRDDIYSMLGSIPEEVPPGQDGVDAAVTRYWDQMDLRLLLFFMNADNADGPTLTSPGAVTAALRIRDAYMGHPGPRTARFPGMLWPFAGFVIDGHTGAVPLMSEAVAHCRAYGDDWAVGVALMFRTHITIDSSGGMKNAEADWAELRELSRRVGDRWMLAQVETAAGEMAASRARLDEARAAYEMARRLAREIGAHTETPFLITRLADVAINGRDLDRAEKLLDQSDEEAAHRGSRDVQSFNRLLRSLIELHRGDLARARTLCDEARRIGEQATPPPQFWILLDGMDARITADEGDAPGALRKVRDNLGRGVETGCAELLLAQQAETAAHALVGCDEERLAARLLGAADAWRGELHRTPLLLREAEKTEAAAQRALGREAAQALRAEGAGLSVEQVIALLDELVTAA
ncbi:AfsR-like regulatory protein [Streptomyces bingchenggensis BCW-1]|uniref:AfsR-like regulatory protein n=1 Tax=Streptomyces bingchenggensis (strain BCW-1) TaxID=749414 RepID=D7CEK2_STRBB|nr:MULTISPECIES: BTAD domain-containing putative transcriptional regulator [Streptomyces]ADI08898.1 AfsR-like regulatory protein [Streptomyces bingchenggensis BCW-1]